MADSRRYLDWYTKSEHDLKAAETLYKYDCDNSIAAFLCQQSIEKNLKGFILKHTGILTDGHSLPILCKKANEINGEFREYLKDCSFVTQFYIETRYPADILMSIDNYDVEECIKSAKSIQDYVQQEDNLLNNSLLSTPPSSISEILTECKEKERVKNPVEPLNLSKSDGRK